ncbi:MAG TPA: polysaccharide deacetylase family protein [Thermoanaerobaculia bacterium]|nr:polysaccharide deacetylase family protein [Thermoanaerobaculia bacterium]
MTSASAGASGLGLRVDVDTHDGMRLGVPRLLDLFATAGVKATFYWALGPDRSGLAVLNVFRPGFLRKMTRTGAARIYGWRTILSGTLLPARPVASAFPAVAKRAASEGHETGVHAWDHRAWQDRLLKWPGSKVAAELDRARDAYLSLHGVPPRTFAAPAWLTCDSALLHQESYDLEFASDCRGVEPFLPRVEGKALETPQVPSTLPTLDEALGGSHAHASDYFDEQARMAMKQEWPVFTLHAELEGGPYAEHFLAFLASCAERGLAGEPLGQLLARRLSRGARLPVCQIGYRGVPGRHGVLAHQMQR